MSAGKSCEDEWGGIESSCIWVLELLVPTVFHLLHGCYDAVEVAAAGCSEG